MPMPPIPLRAARAAVSCLGVIAAAGALAEPNPYYIGAGVTFGHDSNVVRAPDNTGDFSDNYHELYALFGLDQPIGRQRLYVDARVGRTQYNDLSRFDNTNYGARAGVEWEALDRLKGDLRYSANRNRVVDAGGVNTDAPNMETAQEFLFRAQYGLVSLLSLTGEYTHRELDYTNALFSANEVKQDSVKAGVLYRPSGLLTVGTGVRFTRGDYVNRVDGEFDRTDLEFTARLEATGQSTIEALVSIGREDHDNEAVSDVSGATGYLRWIYKPTGKLSFTTQVSRERGRDSAFLNTGSTSAEIGDQNQSRIANTLDFEAVWAATAKIAVTGDARYTQRDLANTGLNSNTGKDRTTLVGLGVRYEITRNSEASCKVGREKRSVSGTITLPYSANFVSCSAQFLFR